MFLVICCHYSEHVKPSDRTLRGDKTSTQWTSGGGQGPGMAVPQVLSSDSCLKGGSCCTATPCSLASITTAAGRSTHCPGTLAFITAAARWSTQRCPWTLALIIDIAAVS
ncbi:hypothetical protein ACOMHN_043696 [Nucella lapillus]